MAALFVAHGIDAVIATNTTVAREGVEGLRDAQQTGGLSGGAAEGARNRDCRQLAATLAGRLPIIAAGGILSGRMRRKRWPRAQAWCSCTAASVYEGPALVGEVASALT
jgi:dihydroorotate dehydrogenase